MSKNEKERTRRIKKMGKHVEALRALIPTEKGQNTLDEMEESLALLKGDHPSQGGIEEIDCGG